LKPLSGSRQRAAAVCALVLTPAVLLLAAYIVVTQFPRGLIVFGCMAIALAAGWYGLLRRGGARILGLTVAVAALAAPAVLLISDGDHVVEGVLLPIGTVLAAVAARRAFRVKVPLAPAARPERASLFYNPKSGGGKAERFSLAEEARARGIEPIELTRGADLEQLTRAAVAGGADALAMAGGDGSQAVVAMVASEFDLPYACVPAGTRNHFALDLGVDRDDVVGALDAFVDGGERRVDLAEVSGRVFVNNVSLGLYAEAVQRPGYREAKLRTILDTVPDVLGPGGGRARSRMVRAQRARAPRRSRGARFEQPLPAREGGRLRDPSADRRRRARNHGCLRTRGPWGRPTRAASLARVVGGGVRGRFEPPGSGGHRRRGRDARGAAPIPHPTRGAARADCARPPGRLAIGGGSGGALGGRQGPRRHRRGPSAGIRMRGIRDRFDEIDRLDHAAYEAIARTPTPRLDGGMRALSRTADHSKLSLAAATALALVGGPEGRGAAARGMASVAVTATVVNAVIKPLFRRRRPDRASALIPSARTVDMPRSRSFPSGHTAAAFAFATGAGRVLPWTGPPLSALAALVGYSRVHTGVHYPVDVIVGAICGVTLAEATCLWLDQRM